MLIDILEPMGAQFDRLRCEVCQNLFLSPMNTGFLRHAVATVLTVYGIETKRSFGTTNRLPFLKLQQCLPFTVLKHNDKASAGKVYYVLQQCLPFTVLKHNDKASAGKVYYVLQQCLPFTVLKHNDKASAGKVYYVLQQCLPFTVLKH